MICTFTHCCPGDKIEKNGMGEACSAYEEAQKHIQVSGGEN